MDEKEKKFIKLISEKTKINPAFIHLDLIGLTKLAKDNYSRMEKFSEILSGIESEGGNICIPSYTLSYTRNEIYSMNESPVVNAGVVSEYIRKNFFQKRTVDALFSYIVFGKNISESHFEVRDYDSFGKRSLIEEVFEKDGYIWTIGGVFKNSTEIHFIEKLIGVNYREDKVFSGVITDGKGKSYNQKVIFFCKNFDYRYWYDFKGVENDLRKDGLMETIKTEGFPMFISGIKIRVLAEYLAKKVSKDPKYICKKLHYRQD